MLLGTDFFYLNKAKKLPKQFANFFAKQILSENRTFALNLGKVHFLITFQKVCK